MKKLIVLWILCFAVGFAAGCTFELTLGRAVFTEDTAEVEGLESSGSVERPEEAEEEELSIDSPPTYGPI